MGDQQEDPQGIQHARRGGFMRKCEMTDPDLLANMTSSP